MIRWGALLLATTCALVPAADAPAQTRARDQAHTVDQAISSTLDVISSQRITPPRAARLLAAVSVAMDDGLARASRHDSSVHGPTVARSAALVVLQAVTGERMPPNAGSRSSGSPSRRAGARLGREAARAVLHRLASDGADTAVRLTPPAGPDAWTPTPPTFAAPLDPGAGSWRTWNLTRGDALRPPPPPRRGSDAFRDDIAHVYELSRPLSAENATLAEFWNDGPGSETPPGHWNRIAMEILGPPGESLRRRAHAFALLNTAQADAFIACWEAKFHYWLARPVTILRRTDPTWTPHLPTPAFPSYPSGHAATSGAAAAVLARLRPRHARRLSTMAEQAAQSRVYGGIHYTFDSTAGLAQGRSVARAAFRAAPRATLMEGSPLTPLGDAPSDAAERARRTWTLGDYTKVAGRLEAAAAELVGLTEIAAAQRVLDVAAVPATWH